MDPLGTWPTPVSDGPDQRIEKDLAVRVQDADLDDLIGARIEPRGFQVQEDGSHQSRVLRLFTL